jgi:hypothetical protein
MKRLHTSFSHLYQHFNVHPPFDAIMTVGLVQAFEQQIKNIEANTTADVARSLHKMVTGLQEIAVVSRCCQKFAQDGNRLA